MFFLVEMEVKLPPDMRADVAEALKLREREIAQELQRQGRWRELWRIVGQWANVSIFEVGSPEELQELLTGLPLFPYMTIRVRALARHPSAIE